MSWDIKDVYARRLEFVNLASQGGIFFAELCRRFGISRKTGYKWVRRFSHSGAEALRDQKPVRLRRKNQTSRRVEQAVVRLRSKHPTWGPRKLHRYLLDKGLRDLPKSSSVGRILAREGCISTDAALTHRPRVRFERAEPNELWQMDFKGHFAMHSGRCHPLTVIDDCSRYLLGLFACADEQTQTVQTHLLSLFALHGLPANILCDNGPPWGGTGPELTRLCVWLLRLGVHVIHGRAFHPQTQGKDERFHRTLKADLLARNDWFDLPQAQRRFDSYRRLYNHQRPHDALGLDVPAKHYRPSARALPEQLPVVVYEPHELVRTVKSKGEITFANRFYYIGGAFAGLPVALRPTATNGILRVCYGAFCIGCINQNASSSLPNGHYHPLEPSDQKVLPP